MFVRARLSPPHLKKEATLPRQTHSRRRSIPPYQEQGRGGPHREQRVVRDADPDWYPDPPEDPLDRGARSVLPFGAVDWLYVSVLFVTEHTALLLNLDNGTSTGPKIWTAPTDRFGKNLDLRDVALRTLRSTTGIELEPRKLQLLDDCPVFLANFGGATRHVFFVAEWRKTDGIVPTITLPDGVADHRFFAPDELPTMSVPYCRDLIGMYFRQR